ncbi:MAG: hypothetical protein KatS3mg110_2955 [Pirellulaceae bacterium]|nr:MAG: hypothetical protein KatS3mg110_2955 [Pirellulaceae bacterium]
MKVSTRRFLVSILCGLGWVAAARAQTVQTVSDTPDYFHSASTSVGTSAEGDTCCVAGGADYCGLGGWLRQSCLLGDYASGEAPEPWALIDHMPRLRDNGYSVGGWISFGYQNKPDGAFTGNGPLLDDREWTSFNLNQAWLYIARTPDTGGCGWDWGFRVDLLYGVDGNEGQSFGNNPGRFDFLNGWDHGIYEWALPQVYAEIAYNDLSVKIGHFFTIIGYEVIPPLGNFFLSRQITFYNAEPFTHTGVLATYQYSEEITLTGGWALGWDTGFDQLNQGNLVLSAMSWNISEDVVLALYGAYGNAGWRGSRTNVSGAILSLQWTERFSTVHQFDVLGTNRGTDFVADGVAGDSIGMIHYAFYQLTDRVKSGIRQEWWKADSVSYYTLTGGFNVQATPNVMIRPELRYLWSPGTPGGAPGSIADNIARIFDKEAVFGVDVTWTY